MNERDTRLNLLNTLLTTPHRDLASIFPVHQEIIGQDPRFYSRMAAWYWDNGDVRDHREMFVVSLCLSKVEGHRDIGLALLRRLPPYEVARVVDFIKGKPARKKPETPEQAKAKAEATASKSARKRSRKAAPAQNVAKEVTSGLGLNVPRSMKTEIEGYLREREADPKKFDAVALHARASLKRLYAGLHIAPGLRAQKVLFDEVPPENSTAFVLKQVANTSDPSEQARLLAEHRVPYRVAASVIKAMTPMTLAVLVDAMSPQEVINNVASLKKRGAFDNPDLKAMIEEKLDKAKSSGRVSAFKAKVAVEAAGATGELAEKLDAITDAQVKAKGRIARPTALMIDKSASMHIAIDVGKQLGAMISSVCEAELFTYAFDTTPYRIEVEGDSLSAWEKGLADIKAGNATSCGVALEWMRRRGQRVEQIVMVTDEGENTGPKFADTYLNYANELKVRPDVVFVKVGGASNTLERDCDAKGITYRAWEFKGDYYALTNLIPLLSRPSMLDLLMEVLDYPLPMRAKN